MQDVKIHANWNLNPTTFETYYLKPLNRESTEARIVTSNFFVTTEKSTYHIWKVGEESTAVIVGTSCNQTVDVTETGRFGTAHPVYTPSHVWPET